MKMRRGKSGVDVCGRDGRRGRVKQQGEMKKSSVGGRTGELGHGRHLPLPYPTQFPFRLSTVSSFVSRPLAAGFSFTLRFFFRLNINCSHNEALEYYPQPFFASFGCPRVQRRDYLGLY